MASTKLKTSAVAAVLVASLVTPLLLQHQAQAALREQDEAWRQQSNQLAQLSADNQRLAGLLAQPKPSTPVPDNQFRELMRLRGEVGRLKGLVQKVTPTKTAAPVSPEDQIASLAKMYAARVEQLKQWLEANPSEKIPEFKNLTDNDWLNAVEQLKTDAATDDDFARAAANMRANAEMGDISKLQSAWRAYSKENNGQNPTDLSQLTPYLKAPLEDAILQRYEMLPAGTLIPELQPGGDWVITQTAPVNPLLDMRAASNMTNMLTAGENATNRWTLLH